ncbi:MAG TPA: hypothetical protein VKZ60_19775 [Chloroflexota bacterium]|jgi:hypothetical protein|nr:hypothetical protein [Chloroflexota bacterium]
MTTPTPSERRLGPGAGYLLPGLELRHADGAPAPLWSFRGRGPLVVFLHDARVPGSQAYLARLEAARALLEDLGARVLVVAPTAAAGGPFSHLLDPAERLAARLARDGVLPAPTAPAVLVVGRSGEVWAAWAGALLPDAAELRDWLEYALGECRECFCCEQVWPAEWLSAPREQH